MHYSEFTMCWGKKMTQLNVDGKTPLTSIGQDFSPCSLPICRYENQIYVSFDTKPASRHHAFMNIKYERGTIMFVNSTCI